MEKTKKLQLEDFTENGFYGTQEQQYLKAQVREELKEQGFIIDSSFEGDFKTWGTWNIETKMHGRKANNCR
ncbi:hypothetical protein K7Q67_002163 [Enterococcus faecalis]|nr:hypothetical protein [Enterococcus faecalis]